MAKKLTKKKVVDMLAEDIGYMVHVGLRKWTEHPESMNAWRAIRKMADDGAWAELSKLLAGELYPSWRKVFYAQFKANQKGKK